MGYKNNAGALVAPVAAFIFFFLVWYSKMRFCDYIYIKQEHNIVFLSWIHSNIIDSSWSIMLYTENLSLCHILMSDHIDNKIASLVLTVKLCKSSISIVK